MHIATTYSRPESDAHWAQKISQFYQTHREEIARSSVLSTEHDTLAGSLTTSSTALLTATGAVSRRRRVHNMRCVETKTSIRC